LGEDFGRELDDVKAAVLADGGLGTAGKSSMDRLAALMSVAKEASASAAQRAARMEAVDELARILIEEGREEVTTVRTPRRDPALQASVVIVSVVCC